MSLPASVSHCFCRNCAWHGTPREVVPLASLVSRTALQYTTDISILPAGGCPRCNMPVHTLSAEERLALIVAMIGPEFVF